MADGAFCLVLHGHLPWVLNHGRWPHGEDWLFEAAAETWLPLIEVLDQLDEEGIRPGWTLGMTPVLLEQLATRRFQEGMVAWLQERRERALEDAAREDLAPLANRWASHFADLERRFEAVERDLIAAVRGRPGVELLTSNATHGFHPLILHDRCARAQVRAGRSVSAHRFGRAPALAWLPECAYRPDGPWTPSAVHGDTRLRDGVATVYASAGIHGFVVDTHLVEGCDPVWRLDGDQRIPVTPDDPSDSRQAWRSVLEPLHVVENDKLTGVVVLARCPDVSEQVWSGDVGYPGDPRYLEFHKRHGLRGLRYWRVTGPGVDLGGKTLYEPHAVPDAVRSHAQHFVGTVERRLNAHQAGTGRYGAVCAPFDAELFGHWWHEGPRFLREVARQMAQRESIDALTLSEFHQRVPADKAGRMPAGTWGAGGDYRVWQNDELRFYWEIVYRAEDRFLDLRDRSRGVAAADTLMKAAARQLLFLEASDWPFVIHTRGAVDYGMRRILDHAGRFDDLCNGVEDVLSGRAEDPVVRNTLERCQLLEPAFEEIQLEWWDE